jgi:hypothetical protein
MVGYIAQCTLKSIAQCNSIGHIAQCILARYIAHCTLVAYMVHMYLNWAHRAMNLEEDCNV